MSSVLMLSLLAALTVAAPTEPQRPRVGNGSEPAPPVTPVADAAAAYRARLLALCAEQMAGRAAGSKGGGLAIEYLEREFVQLGLEPFGPALRQDFLAPAAPPECGSATSLRVEVGGRQEGFAAGTDFVPFPFSPDGRFEGDVVFAGHGLVVPELGIDDFAGRDVKGRVVLVLRGGPRWRDGKAPVRAHVAQLSFAAKVQNAAARGAIAVVLVDRRGDAGTELLASTVRAAIGSAAVPLVWVSRTAAARCLGDDWLDGAQRALDAGQAPPPLPACATLRGEVALLRQPPRGTANVLACVPGRDAALAREWIVVGAHHDHIGHGEFGSLGVGAEIGRLHPGADDNASGVAAVLELARRARAAGPRRRGVVFAAFGAEELGQAGSRWFLDHLPGGAVIAAMVDLDMIGRASSSTLTVYGAGSADCLLAAIATARRIDTEFPLAVRDRTSYRSDQWAFLERRVPALLFTTGLHDQYHRPGDVPELIEVDAALRVVAVVEQLVAGLADGARPKFVADDGK